MTHLSKEFINTSLDRILDKDPAMFDAIGHLSEYLASTYDDKYANSELRNEGIIYSPNLGKGFNAGTAAKYLSRYITTGFSKSENPSDLIKAIHYSLFEFIRKTGLRNQ
jgi:hypothetical protein